MKATRTQVLALRCRTQHLGERLPAGSASLRTAARDGLQDSVPRSALHALSARVEDVEPGAWQDPTLVQVWGPRYTTYLVPAGDHAVFTLSRLPGAGEIRERAHELADRLHEQLDGQEMGLKDVAAALGVHPSRLRYASLTGTVLLRWDGARGPSVRPAPPPDISPEDARAELARRYLHALGPASAESFAGWAGISLESARATFAAIASELRTVTTPAGKGSLLDADVELLRMPGPRTVRLVPSGDPYLLLWGRDRELLVPDQTRRSQLWTSRVWPGSLLVDGEVVGIWRRSSATITAHRWRRLAHEEQAAVEAEAAAMPVPGVDAPVRIRWT